MQLKTAFLSLLLLICPCALCYGQLSFLGVNGERGYSAVRMVYAWDLDNNFIITPSYEFYRQSDAPDVEKTGSTYRYGAKLSYDLSDAWRIQARGFWQPWAVGNRAVSYYAGAVWHPFYRWGVVKDPFIEFRLGQAHYYTWLDVAGQPLEETYKQREINTEVRLGTEVGPWNLQAAWHKVIQYSNPVLENVSFSWADIPFMTAVVQGFLRQAAALRLSYPTHFITPYASVIRYEYAQAAHPALAVNAGLKLTWAETALTGGIEVFEPRHDESRKTFFSMSVTVDF